MVGSNSTAFLSSLFGLPVIGASVLVRRGVIIDVLIYKEL
jgi:hypothetical protein